MSVNKIIILENSRKFLRFHQIWPSKESELNPGKSFYIKHILFAFSTTMFLFSCLAHMIVTLRGNSGAQIDLDISVIVSLIGTYYFNFSFLVNVKNMALAHSALSNLEIFGIPPGFSEFTKKMNRYAKYHYIYISLTLVAFSSAPYLELKRCEENNIERGIHEVCGLISNVWFPFDIDYFPMKQIFYLIQSYSAFFAYATSSTISFSIMESNEHVIFRLKHVKQLFLESFRESSYFRKRELFRKSVQYHNFVISLAKQLEDSYRACIFVHLLFTGAILGCVAYQLLQRVYASTVALLIGWFMSIVMVASGGQRLIDECLSIGDEIYSSAWYDLEVDIQKDLVMVLLRCKKTARLRAGPFGYMSYQVILSILKTAYSIVSLMKATEINN